MTSARVTYFCVSLDVMFLFLYMMISGHLTVPPILMETPWGSSISLGLESEPIRIWCSKVTVTPHNTFFETTLRNHTNVYWDKWWVMTFSLQKVKVELRCDIILSTLFWRSCYAVTEGEMATIFNIQSDAELVTLIFGARLKIEVIVQILCVPTFLSLTLQTCIFLFICI